MNAAHGLPVELRVGRKSATSPVLKLYIKKGQIKCICQYISQAYFKVSTYFLNAIFSYADVVNFVYFSNCCNDREYKSVYKAIKSSSSCDHVFFPSLPFSSLYSFCHRRVSSCAFLTFLKIRETNFPLSIPFIAARISLKTETSS